MKDYIIPKNIAVIGSQVMTFPNGISEAFETLMNQIADGETRVYYGIASCTDKGITYIAAAEERDGDDAKASGLQRYEIEKGIYLATEIKNWRSKLTTIRDVFAEMDNDERTDKSAPSIEIYENEATMWCLVKVADDKSSETGQTKRLQKSGG